ncbi:divalent-cation tolerance protein CutA [Thermaurantiacus tibetensis]|uniref:divalent-cation tolerance protein CutA n=1 Tax=Thermaurantiacus tibetensis TaxID=2759035 RepID=UPI00188F1507|nr:divalent-cation tolerance protein CutA [Thermaurantiacus tibetensis]
MTALVSVYVVFADRAEAERIAREMVEARLAACANLLGPCRSIYRWQGRVEEADEVPAIFKTRADRAEALIAAIAGRHGYEVPAITVWPVDRALEAYAEWVRLEAEGTPA